MVIKKDINSLVDEHLTMRKEQRKKIGKANSIALKGKYCSPKTEFKKGHTKPINGYSFGYGENNFRWKGGTYGTERHREMGREGYGIWRKSVYERDNYICVWCKKRGGRLNADHIQSWALCPELRYAVTNGQTLCIECHNVKNKLEYKRISENRLYL